MTAEYPLELMTTPMPHLRVDKFLKTPSLFGAQPLNSDGKVLLFELSPHLMRIWFYMKYEAPLLDITFFAFVENLKGMPNGFKKFSKTLLFLSSD